jgi:hypothetical protein
MGKILVVLALAVPVLALPGCSAKDKICKPGEVVVATAGGGVSCAAPGPDDPTCESGDILLKLSDGRKGCIPNVYDDGNYTTKLPPTPTR